MPVDNKGESVARQPSDQPPAQSPAQMTGNQNIPPDPTGENCHQDEPIARKLEEDVRTAERWLIGIGIATLIINSFISIIYVKQLKAMREANAAASASSLEASKQFQAQLQHFDAGLGVSKSKTSQTSRLAGATEEANKNARNADRPWLGGMVSVVGFEVGKDPEAFCAFVNGGRRPAFVEHQVCELVGEKIRPAPDVAGEHKPNGLILPGGTVTMHKFFFAGGDPIYIQDGKMTSTLLSLYDSSQWHLRINSTVTYRDIGTGKIHHTNMCVRYQPAQYKNPASWTDCDTGNYAD